MAGALGARNRCACRSAPVREQRYGAPFLGHPSRRSAGRACGRRAQPTRHLAQARRSGRATSPITLTASPCRAAADRDIDRRARHRADRRRRPVVEPAQRIGHRRRAAIFRPHRLARAGARREPARRIPRARGPSVARARRASRALPGEGRQAHQHRRHRARRLERAGLDARRATATSCCATSRAGPGPTQVRELLAAPERWLKWALYDRGAAAQLAARGR